MSCLQMYEYSPIYMYYYLIISLCIFDVCYCFMYTSHNTVSVITIDGSGGGESHDQLSYFTIKTLGLHLVFIFTYF